MPPLRRMPPGQDTVRFAVRPETGGGYAGFDRTFRYAWPAELDLMTRIAGLRLEHRWSAWDRAPFTAESTSHVSVWRRPAA